VKTDPREVNESCCVLAAGMSVEFQSLSRWRVAAVLVELWCRVVSATAMRLTRNRRSRSEHNSHADRRIKCNLRACVI